MSTKNNSLTQGPIQPPRTADTKPVARFRFPVTDAGGKTVEVHMERDKPFRHDEGFRALAMFIKRFPPSAEQVAAAEAYQHDVLIRKKNAAVKAKR